MKEEARMAKKEKKPLSETLLKTYGIASFVGLTGYLFYYDVADRKKAQKEGKKSPWKAFVLTLLLSLLVMAALVGAFLAIRYFFFPNYSLPVEWIAVIGLAAIFVFGTVITLIESRIYRKK